MSFFEVWQGYGSFADIDYNPDNQTFDLVLYGHFGDPIYWEENDGVPQHFQVEFKDSKNKPWFMDQAERFNAFNFNNFLGWECSSGYRSIIIREPDGSIKRSYSCADEPLGYIYDEFKLFDGPMPCLSKSCVSSADSKIPKRKPGTKLPLWPGDKTYELPSV